MFPKKQKPSKEGRKLKENPRTLSPEKINNPTKFDATCFAILIVVVVTFVGQVWRLESGERLVQERNCRERENEREVWVGGFVDFGIWKVKRFIVLELLPIGIF